MHSMRSCEHFSWSQDPEGVGRGAPPQPLNPASGRCGQRAAILVEGTL